MRVCYLYGHLCFCIRRKLGEISRFAHSVRVGEKFLSSLRVILYMGSPQIFNFWGERKQQSPNDISVIHCDLLAERESTTKTTHSTSILRLVAQHLLLQMHSMSITPECYSGILVKNTPSFRKGLG